MNILFIGDKTLYSAIHALLVRENAPKLQFEYAPECPSGSISQEIIIIDSKWYRSFVENANHTSSTDVIITGPYLDSYAKKAFTNTYGFNYIPYSELEVKLISELTRLQQKISDACTIDNAS